MTAPAADDAAPFERAEQLVAQFEQDAERLLRTAAARAVELAEDLWAEAQDLRQSSRSGG